MRRSGCWKKSIRVLTSRLGNKGEAIMDFIAQAEAQKSSLVSLRREFHSHPERSCQEWETAKRIERELDRLGVSHRRVGETGVYASFRGALEGERVIALRADIDALPVEDQKTVAYRSQVPGVMHACGHDAHTTALLGGARLLVENRSRFGGEVRLLFQQAEEIGYGARVFLREGLLEGAQRVFGLHTASDLPVGKIGVRSGPNNASVDHFKITVEGRGAHVSTPQLGADALYIASQIVVGFQGIVTRLTSPTDPVILGVGTLHAGEGYNVVARQAVLEGTVRAFSPETRRLIREKADELARQMASLHGGAASSEWEDYTSPLINDPEICREVCRTAGRLAGEKNVVTDRPLSLGGDDFAELQLRVPGVYAYIGTRNPALPDTTVAHHNGRFDIDEDCLPLAAGLYAACAFDYLTGDAG